MSVAIESLIISIADMSAIVPNPKNTTKHPEKQIKKLMKLIKGNGFRDPVVVSNQSGFLVCGHGRLEAAKRLGMTQLPVVYQSFETPEKELQHMIASNTAEDGSELDLSLVNELIVDLDSTQLDLDMFGLDDFVIDIAEKETKPKDIKINECPECHHTWSK